MKFSTIAPLAFGLGASAAAIESRQTTKCCFGITVAGGVSGPLGQLSDGQNRVGPGYTASTFCIKDGAITDSSNRGCIITPQASQFQCDAGKTPTPGFSISASGAILANGTTSFYACPATSTGVYNIYTSPVVGQAACKPVTLSSTNATCANSGALSSSRASTSSAKATASGSAASVAASASAGSSKASSALSASSVKASSASSVASAAATTIVKASSVSSIASAAATTSVKASSVSPAVPATVTVTSFVTVTPVCSAPNKPSSTLGATTVVVSTAVNLSSSASGPAVAASSAGSSKAASSSAASSVKASTSAAATTSSATATKASSSSAASKASSSAAASTACPANLNGAYQFPHLIVPVNSSAPTTAYGTQYFGTITPTVSSIFNFDIPSSYAGKTCTLVFLFPLQSQLTTSSFTQSGAGGLDFKQLKSPATNATTYANAPAVAADLGVVAAAPGNSYTITSGACAAGQAVSYEISATGSYALRYFQDYNPSPIGLYIREC